MDAELLATRSHGLTRLQAFVPAMGRRYADGRNYDHGPGKHTAVSVLSPWIRRRLVTEPEVVAAALAAHGPEAAGEVRAGGDLARLFQGLAGAAAAGLDQLSPGAALRIWPRSTATLACAATWSGRRAARPGWTVSTPGPESWWRPAICTITRGCGSRRSGSSRSVCPGGWARISSIAICSTAMRRPTRWAGAGSRGCIPAANPIARRPGTSPPSPAGGSPRATAIWRKSRRGWRRPSRMACPPRCPCAR